MIPVLAVNDLVVGPAHGGEALLRGVSIAVRPGQSVGLVGESGSGKTLTALAAIGALPRGLVRRAGTTQAVGQRISLLSPAALRQLLARDIGAVPQDPLAALDPLFSVGDQITEPGRLAGRGGWREAARGWSGAPPDRETATRLLGSVGIAEPERRARQYPHQFSGGMRQRALIAAATSLAPRLVIADEPTTALDASLERQILDLLRNRVLADGGALLLITHDLNLVAWYCDYAYVMAAGTVVEHGPTERLFRTPRHLVTRGLLTSARCPAAAAPTIRSPEILLSLEGVSRRYALGGGRVVTACDGVTLAVHRGELLSLVGESGSGKSTLGRIALGLEAPDGGLVRFGGEDLAKLPGIALRRLRRRFQPVFQDPLSSLNPRWRAGRSILHPLRVHGLCGWPSAAAALQALLAEVELPAALAARYPHQLSGGQRQRVCIARALATRPDLLVADEALAALDVTTQRAVLDLLARLRLRHGMAMLFISHDLRTVRRISDRVAVMSAGRVVECAPPEAVFAAPCDPYTAALIGSLLPPRFPALEAADS